MVGDGITTSIFKSLNTPHSIRCSPFSHFLKIFETDPSVSVIMDITVIHYSLLFLYECCCQNDVLSKVKHMMYLTSSSSFS